MKNIEDRAKPIMIPLMQGQSLRIAPDAQSVIAGWAAVKATVAEHISIGDVTTSQAERDLLRQTGLPPHHGWAVWIGHYERSAWQAYLGSNAFLYLPGPENAHLLGTSPTEYNGQASFQILKNLFIYVMRCRDLEFVERWRFDVTASRFLRKIWPPSNLSIKWPPPIMSDVDADYVASALKKRGALAVQRRLMRNS
ncbi:MULTISPECIES: hypothetical protein [Nitrospirillum]|uniref:hypothetical protein n=1 Tax=Nitrospirillum TaxID=1543705 RepID=UPI0011A80254|nr:MULTISPECIES: hypothetical protein [Nitrospirillum]MEA1673977.1 hypothetical protein [Nitrospirillum sp. BR 11163]